MTYDPTVYVDVPEGTTPPPGAEQVSAENLNKGEQQLSTLDSRVTVLEGAPGATTAGVVNVRSYGVVGNGTNESAGIVNARNAVLNSRPSGGSSPKLPMLYFPPPEGDAYVVTSPDVLLPTAGNKIAGYETSKISFRPTGTSASLTDMNMITAVGAAAPRLAGTRIKNICFDSTNATACFAYLFSDAVSWVQDTLLDNVRFSGTWKRIIGLDGDADANLNSEMTFDRIVTTGATFSDAFFHSGLTTPATFSAQDQFLNYWARNCKFEQASGSTFIMDKGGHLVCENGSYIIGDSGSGTHFKMGDYSHFDSVQYLKVSNVRFELRNVNSRVIDCAWRGGHVVFDNIDDEAMGFQYQLNGTGAGTANFDTHVYRTPQNAGPWVTYKDCGLMGYHRVVTTATQPDAKWHYEKCNFRNMQGGGSSLLSTATNQFLRYDSAAPHRKFSSCRYTTDSDT